MGQGVYSDLAIETSLTLRTVFELPLQQTEGFVGSLLGMLGLDHFPAPDHSTLSRRAQSLRVVSRTSSSSGPIHKIVDSTGLQIVGEGPWSAAEHGTGSTRDWRKLHIGVDERDLSRTAQCEPPVQFHLTRSLRFTADGAYDKMAVYESLA